MATPVKSFSDQILNSLSTRSFKNGNSHADKAIRGVFAAALLGLIGGVILLGAPSASAPAGYSFLGVGIIGGIGNIVYHRRKFYKEKLKLTSEELGLFVSHSQIIPTPKETRNS